MSLGRLHPHHVLVAVGGRFLTGGLVSLHHDLLVGVRGGLLAGGLVDPRHVLVGVGGRFLTGALVSLHHTLLVGVRGGLLAGGLVDPLHVLVGVVGGGLLRTFGAAGGLVGALPLAGLRGLVLEQLLQFGDQLLQGGVVAPASAAIPIPGPTFRRAS